MEKLYTLLEAREYLKVSDSTIRRYIRIGKIKAQKLGRQYRFTETAIQEFMDSQNGKDELNSDDTQVG